MNSPEINDHRSVEEEDELEGGCKRTTVGVVVLSLLLAALFVMVAGVIWSVLQ